jgi:TRAP-type C4-dicarboxylate transport system permease small subunit
MKAADLFKKIDKAVLAALKALTVTIFIAITLILTANVFVRYVPIISLHWLDEIVEMLFAALVFYGAAGAWILKGHFSAGDWIGKRFKNPRIRAALRALIDLATFAFIAIFFRYSINLVSRSLEVTAVFQIPKKILYSCMPVSSGLMGIYSLKFIALDIIGIIKPKPIAPAAGEKA